MIQLYIKERWWLCSSSCGFEEKVVTLQAICAWAHRCGVSVGERNGVFNTRQIVMYLL